MGLSAALALAAALPSLGGACGLGTGSLLAADLVAEPLVPAQGVLRVGRTTPDVAALELATATMADDRQQWWWARLRRSHALLAASNAAH